MQSVCILEETDIYGSLKKINKLRTNVSLYGEEYVGFFKEEFMNRIYWDKLDEYHKIKAIYDFVQNKIVLGFNSTDLLKATQVLVC